MSSASGASSGPNKRSTKDEKSKPTSKDDSPAGASNKDDNSTANANPSPAQGSSNGAPTPSSGGGGGSDVSQPSSKPGSAGAQVREATQRLLGIATRGEWSAADQVLKILEKAAQSQPEDSHLAPLAGLVDPVSFFGSINFTPVF